MWWPCNLSLSNRRKERNIKPSVGRRDVNLMVVSYVTNRFCRSVFVMQEASLHLSLSRHCSSKVQGNYSSCSICWSLIKTGKDKSAQQCATYTQRLVTDSVGTDFV